MPCEGPLGGHGAVKSLDFAVGLGSVGACPLVRDVQFSAGIAPGVGFVAGAVVGQDPLDVDSTHGEPGHCAAEDADGSVGGFVVMDLGVGHPGVVVDDGVYVGVAQDRLMPLIPRHTGHMVAVALALSAAEETPAAAGGNVTEFLDVDVYQRSGTIVFMASDRLSGANVDV
ncbi:MAG: hypothetical protein QOK02_3155 [Mycobacterium sp.]|nr:hypothetical protein [Mycobacterium sp.]